METERDREGKRGRKRQRERMVTSRLRVITIKYNS